MRRIGEDISEKLNFRPAQFYKEQHIRGKWVCGQCDTLTQQAMPAHVIDKSIASAELLSHVLVSKYADHLPLYRQRQIFLRAGIDLSRSTLSDWVGRCGVELEPLADALKHVVLQQWVIHADETPVTIMRMGENEKKPKKGYVWAYATTQYNPVQAVIYDFQDSRSGQHAEEFLKGWQALCCYLDDGNLSIDNNWIENQMRPWALGRKNWLFAGSLRSGQRAANVMTLIQSAKLNGLDPYAYLSDVLKRLPTHKVTQIEELLPHRWKPNSN